MKAGTGEKKKSYAILAASAGIFLIALSLSGFFLVQIIGRMNLSANQNLLISSRVIRGGLNNEIVLDRKLLGTLAELLALEQEDAIGETLEKYADSTDFFRFSFVDVEGNGIDSQGNTIHASDLNFPLMIQQVPRDWAGYRLLITVPADGCRLRFSIL